MLATPTGPLDPGRLELDAESADAGWFPLDALADVPLHPGLAAALPVLRALLGQP